MENGGNNNSKNNEHKKDNKHNNNGNNNNNNNDNDKINKNNKNTNNDNKNKNNNNDKDSDNDNNNHNNNNNTNNTNNTNNNNNNNNNNINKSWLKLPSNLMKTIYILIWNSQLTGQVPAKKQVQTAVWIARETTITSKVAWVTNGLVFGLHWSQIMRENANNKEPRIFDGNPRSNLFYYASINSTIDNISLQQICANHLVSLSPLQKTSVFFCCI